MHTWLTNQVTLELNYKQKDDLLNISLFAVDNDCGVLDYGIYMISTQSYLIWSKACLWLPITQMPAVVMEGESPSLHHPHPHPSLLPAPQGPLLPSEFCPTTGGFLLFSDPELGECHLVF